MKEREYWLDAAKGIGILLVAIGHNGVLCKFLPLHGIIFAFHMPLFFILSGITITPTTSQRNISIRAMSLYWVYLAVCLATIPFALNRDDSEGVTNIILGIVYGCGYTIHMTPLWYLVCLALATPIAWIIIKNLESSAPQTLLPTSITLLFLGWLILEPNDPTAMKRVLNWGNEHQGFFANIDLIPTAVGFLIAGRFISKNISHILNAHWLVIFALSIALGLITYESSSGLDLNLRSVPKSFAGYIFSSFSGSIVTIWICQHLNFKFLAKLGASTLPILAFHPALTNKISFQDKSSFLLAVLGTIVGVGLPYLADQFFFKKYKLGQVFFYPRKFLKI